MLSNRLFTQLFASELLSLSRDPVVNVRLRLVRLMPEIAVACGTKTAFVTAMENLLSDSDEELREEAELAKAKIAALPPRTPEMKAEDAEKEAIEKKFFVHRNKRKTGAKSGARPAESAPVVQPEFQTPIRRNASFTNNPESPTGAKHTVVVHSVLGAAGAAPLAGGGLTEVDGSVLAANSIGNTNSPPPNSSTTETTTTFGSETTTTNNPGTLTSSTGTKKKPTATRPASGPTATRKRTMCGCFG